MLAPVWGLLTVKAVARTQRPVLLRNDALGYWSYLASAAVDGDVDIRNQPMPRYLRKDGQQRYYPLGVAISLIPGFAAAHFTALLIGDDGTWLRPNGYSLIYEYLATAQIALMLTLAAAMSVSLARRRLGVGAPVAIFAAGLWFFGTNVSYFLVTAPVLSHTIGLFWVAALLWCGDRVGRANQRAWSPWLWLTLAGVSLGMAMITRLTNGVFFLPLLLLLLQAFRRGAFDAVAKSRPMAAIGLALASFVIGVMPLIAQLSYNETRPADVAAAKVKASDGIQGTTQVPEHVAAGIGYQSHEVFFWTDPALLRVLFSSFNGLFFETPLLLVAFAGVCLALRRDSILVGAIGAFVLLWYVNAAWWSWWLGGFGDVGHRGFIELGPIWILGLAEVVRRVEAWKPTGHRLALAVILLSASVTPALAIAQMTVHFRENTFLFQIESRTFGGRDRRF